MHRIILNLAVSLLTLAAGIFAGSIWRAEPPAPVENQTYSIDEQQLLAIENQYVEAERTHDLEFFERLNADNFTLIDANGTVRNKAEAIDELRRSEDVYDEISSDDIQIHIYGETAIVTGRCTARGHDEDGPYTNQTRWTDVFVKSHGRWRLVNTQITDAADDALSER